MYLSRLILNPRNRRVQSELARPYEMHKSLMRAFPSGLAEGEERMLFRVDEIARYQAPAVLVQSLLLPDWSWLADDEAARGYLLPVSEPNPALKAFNLTVAVGQVLGFRLRANPTVKKEDEKGRPVRRGLLTEEKQTQWLVRKGDSGGFRVITVNIAREGKVGGSIHRARTQTSEKATHDLTLLAVRFDGVLQVIDPDQLLATLRQGIGSGKGFGFGLLSLAPAPM